MNEFEIEIVEVLERKVKVKASTYKEALSMVQKDYREENIVLDSSDCIGHSIK